MSGALGGATATVATGAAVTVSVVVPGLVSLVAVTVAVPALTPVTTPVVALMVATVVGVTDHVTVRPDNVSPLASLVVAVRGVVWRSTTDGFDGEMVTVATGIGGTVITDVAVLVSLLAVIVALPALCPVTRPFASTEAIVGALDIQVTRRLCNTFPDASLVVSVSANVALTCTVALVGATMTTATGTRSTVTGTEAAAVSLFAVIDAVPRFRPVTTPLGDTDATDDPLLDHVTVRPFNALPAESRTVAVSVTVCPESIVAPFGRIDTDATDGGATGNTVIVASPC
jgi:hypothetical protein